MRPQPVRLPDRFPVGTRYVIEGRGGGEGRLQVHLRYLEYPDGRQIELPVELPADMPAKLAQRSRSGLRRRGRRVTGRK
jgi:hypothetical protein